MAEDKKGFILYADQKSLFNKLSNEKAGELIKHIFAYVNDEDPEADDLLIDIAFEPIKTQLKRDLIKFQKAKEQRVEAGKASAEARRIKRESTKLNEAQRKATTVESRSTKSTVIGNGNVNGNVNVIKEDNRQQEKNLVDWDELKKYFIKITGKKIRAVNSKSKSQINARLKEGYTKDDIALAIRNCYADEYHIEHNHKYLTLEFISRAEKLEKYSTIPEKKKVVAVPHWNEESE